MEQKPTLGKLLKGNERRDAIHIAIAPMIAHETLFPGDRVGLTASGNATRAYTKPLGIVDPFLEDSVKAGQGFYVFLMPNTITNLRHEWEHPEFDKARSNAPSLEPAQNAILVITAMANEAGITYEEMLAYAREYATTGEYACQGGRWEGGPYCDDSFWDAYEIVTGTKVEKRDRGGVFTCSC